MREASHTPGPWIIAEDDHGALSVMAGVVVNEQPQHFTIAEVLATGVDDHPEQAEANAALIAAAPDLYEALRRMVDVFGPSCADGLRGSEGDTLTYARAALAKVSSVSPQAVRDENAAGSME